MSTSTQRGETCLRRSALHDSHVGRRRLRCRGYTSRRAHGRIRPDAAGSVSESHHAVLAGGSKAHRSRERGGSKEQGAAQCV